MGPAPIATGVMRLSWSLPFKRFIASTSFALIGLPSIYGIGKIPSARGRIDPPLLSKSDPGGL